MIRRLVVKGYKSAEALRQVIATFLEGTPRFLEGLRDAASRGDAPGMQRVGHTLKSTSAMLGATALSAQRAELERLSRAGTVPDGVSRVAAIDALYHAVKLALKAEAAGSPTPLDKTSVGLQPED